MKTNFVDYEYGMVDEMDKNNLNTTQQQACFEEIHSVLKKHNALDRFGITLIGNDKLADDQIYLEHIDLNKRLMVCEPIAKNSTQLSDAIETNWQLDNIKALTNCTTLCSPTKSKGHNQNHKEAV